MTGSPPSFRSHWSLLRAGRSAIVLVALLALLGLTSAPHRHAGSIEERSCPACQVTRTDGGEAPSTAQSGLPSPEGIDVPTLRISLDVAGLRTHAAPLPSRGPPPVSPAEQL